MIEAGKSVKTKMEAGGALVPLRGLTFHMTDEPWPFAIENQERIAAHWQEATARNPHLWNGEVLIGRRAQVVDGILTGIFSKTDYASFTAWRAAPSGDGACHIFGMPGIITADDAIVFGIMADHTYNAGRIYPPGGSLDPSDIRPDGTMDILGSIVRELREETGLEAAEASPLGLYAIPIDSIITVVSFLRFKDDAASLERKVAAHLRREVQPELKGLHLVRQASDITREMSDFSIEIAMFYLHGLDALTGPA